VDLTLDDLEREALDTLVAYGEIPCLSPQFDPDWAGSGHIGQALHLLATWARERELADLDVSTSYLEGRTPVLVVTVGATAPVEGTCVLYGHLDKQPPLGEWSEGLGPFSPVRRGNRLYARGVADDGYSVFSALLALEALERLGEPHARCVVLIEASEESGSSDLEAHLDALAPHLGQVDLMVCLDSGAHSYDRLWVTTSLRGLVNVEVSVAVLERAAHSGAASGVVPSSFRLLRQLLDRVEDAATGRVLLPEAHAEVPAAVRRAAESLTDAYGDVAAKSLAPVAGLRLQGESAADRVLARTWEPALSIIGLGGVPAPRDAGNVLRRETTAVLSLRLPPTVDADACADALVRRLLEDPPSGARVTAVIDSTADGWAAPELAPWLDLTLTEASLAAFGQPQGLLGEGGSIPFLHSLTRRYPGVQIVATGVLGPGANAHGIDEMLDLDAMVAVTNAVARVVRAHAVH
jgi:acetylornithine deacetylase/succinyl-diaminopimelate desuccinylase-like protein